MEVHANGIAMTYRIEGSGPWLVMGHSLACDSRMWSPQIDALADRFTVLAFDARGHGGTDATPGPYSLDLLADDAMALFAAVGVVDAHWLGLSMGGILGQVIEIRHPGTFHTLVLADTTCKFPAAAVAAFEERMRLVRESGMEAIATGTIERWFTADFFRDRPDTTEMVRGWIAATEPEGYCGCAAAVTSVDTASQLHTITIPTLVLCGEQDIGTPPSAALALRDLIPGSEMTIIADAGHLSNLQQPMVFNQAISQFYQRHVS